MPSNAVLNIPALLEPISDEAPAGIDLREDPNATTNYFTVKDARNAARANERSRLFDDTSSHGIEQEWRTVLEVAPRILQEESKDLEIATWLLEALVRYHGFRGLKEGFELIQGLVEKHWDHLYPRPDEDGMETKVAPLTGLNGEGGEGTLLAPLRSIPFTEDSSVGEYSFWQYQQARDISRITNDDERKDRIAATGISQDKIDQAVSESSASFFNDILDNLDTALNHFNTYNRFLDEHCGYDAPPASNIRQAMDDIKGAIKHLAGFKLESLNPSPQNEQAELTPTSSNTVSQNRQQSIEGPIQSREQAFQQLDQIALFFQKTEPHSPLSYLLQKSVRWGRMSLPELMKELLPDSSTREHFSQLTGAVIEENDAY